LKPGGRFVGEFGGKGNVEIIRAALHAALDKRGIDPWTVDPWYYPSPEEYANLLGRFGFNVKYIELIPRPTTLPADILAWLEIFAQPFFKALVETERGKYIEEVRSALAPILRRPDGAWIADYNTARPHSSLGYKTPVAYAGTLTAPKGVTLVEALTAAG